MDANDLLKNPNCRSLLHMIDFGTWNLSSLKIPIHLLKSYLTCQSHMYTYNDNGYGYDQGPRSGFKVKGLIEPQ